MGLLDGYRLQIKHFEKLVEAQAMVCGNVLEDAGEGSGLERRMVGNDFVILTIALRRYADVRSSLARWGVTEGGESFYQARAVNIPW